MKTSFTPAAIDEIRAPLRKANLDYNRAYPGETARRQPVHTVYGGAHLFRADTARKLGEGALKSLQENAPDAATLASVLGFGGDAAFARKVHARVTEKLAREAVEDFRIDFEDGYGNRPDAEEDGHAESAAREVARGFAAGTLPPFIGIRVKTFSEELAGRSLRTLDIFVTTLLAETGGKLPPGFVITLPKVSLPEQVRALDRLLALLETRNGLKAGALEVELMVETPQSIISHDGVVMLPLLVQAAGGRCIAAHFGTYDYTASCNITAAHQHMAHPACDFAKHVMQVTLAGTGVMLSDGATNVMPVGARDVIHRAWKLSYDHIRHSLVGAFYQGWDLHPAQIPVRYAALYAFFLEGLEPASARLKNFMEKAAQATLVGDVFDDAATGQGLLNFFLRGIGCGAITEDEARLTGLTMDEIRTRSFLKILNGRKGK